MASFLIVDEDRAFREALAIALRLEGHEASAVGDAESARERLAAAPVDCCLVDDQERRHRSVPRTKKEKCKAQLKWRGGTDSNRRLCTSGALDSNTDASRAVNPCRI